MNVKLLHSSPSDSEKTRTEQFWRSLTYFNVYRLIIATGVVLASWQSNSTNLGTYNHELFLYTTLGYAALCCLSIFLVKIRSLIFDRQLAFQVITDIVFICIMIYASGGLQSGLGVLLLVSLTGAGLISRGKLALFFASLASIGLLLQETYALLYVAGYSAQYTQIGLLCMGYFAVAWLAHRLATRAIVSERLALQRGADLESMAKVNQLVIQDMQDGVLVVGSHGEIRQHNLSAEKLIGLESNTGITNALMLSDYAPVLSTRLAAWYENSDTKFGLLRLSVSNTLVRTRFVFIKADQQTGAVIFLEDMSRIQAQAQQLKLAALGRLTANIAHEIRNPLSAISHAAELLGEDPTHDPTTLRLLRIIHDNTQRLNKIVQDALQLNRRDTAKLEPLDAKKFIQQFIRDFCHAEKVNTEIFKQQVAESKIIIFDSNHLNQVLWNLCRNAWRHCCKKKGSIQLILTDSNDKNWFNIDIIDDGSGVSQIQVKHLFEPFITTETSGTGLGLSIAREMCEINNASLNYIEDHVGGHFRIVCKKKLNHGDK